VIFAHFARKSGLFRIRSSQTINLVLFSLIRWLWFEDCNFLLLNYLGRIYWHKGQSCLMLAVENLWNIW
jgi:hypothetical protein